MLSEITIESEGISTQDITEEKCGLFIVRGGILVQASSLNLGPFKIYTHIPISYDNQTPIAIHLTDETGGKISSYKIVDNYPGSNALLEISFENLETTDIISFYWNAPVFLKFNDFQDLPEDNEIAPLVSLPDDVTPWLASTEFIQAAHPEIQSKALEIAGNRTEVLSIADDVVNYTRNTVFTEREGQQDALSTLQKSSGNCVGKSNLAVAILRALGIPARVVLEGPTPHYLAELYAHPYGWVRLEPTTGDSPWPYHGNVITYCAFPEDETSSHYVNGINPSEGFVIYWGETNSEILWGFRSGMNSIKRHYLNTSKQDFNTALNLSKEIWIQQKRCLDLGLTENGNEKYNQAIASQKVAAEHFINGSYSNFLLNLQDSYNIFSQIADNATNTPFIPEESSWIPDSLHTTIFIFSAPILTLMYIRRRRKY
ncbi:MAG: transglutaminase-like domain-containing protein [Candidatus Heimdallarchaeaceae archaeon]